MLNWNIVADYLDFFHSYRVFSGLFCHFTHFTVGFDFFSYSQFIFFLLKRNDCFGFVYAQIGWLLKSNVFVWANNFELIVFGSKWHLYTVPKRKWNLRTSFSLLCDLCRELVLKMYDSFLRKQCEFNEFFQTEASWRSSIASSTLIWTIW